MSAPVVYINGKPCTRRGNRKEDAETLSSRRLMDSMGAAAFADSRDDTLESRSAALAAYWWFERKLPRNNLRLIAGTLDERKDFEVRLSDRVLASAECELHNAKRMRLLRLGQREAAEAMRDEAERLSERAWQATVDLANSPVFTAADLRRKKAAIGNVWLNAEGKRYDVLRAGIATDEARLASHATRSKRLTR